MPWRLRRLDAWRHPASANVPPACPRTPCGPRSRPATRQTRTLFPRQTTSERPRVLVRRTSASRARAAAPALRRRDGVRLDGRRAGRPAGAVPRHPDPFGDEAHRRPDRPGHVSAGDRPGLRVDNVDVDAAIKARHRRRQCARSRTLSSPPPSTRSPCCWRWPATSPRPTRRSMAGRWDRAKFSGVEAVREDAGRRSGSGASASSSRPRARGFGIARDRRSDPFDLRPSASARSASSRLRQHDLRCTGATSSRSTLPQTDEDPGLPRRLGVQFGDEGRRARSINCLSPGVG